MCPGGSGAMASIAKDHEAHEQAVATAQRNNKRVAFVAGYDERVEMQDKWDEEDTGYGALGDATG